MAISVDQLIEDVRITSGLRNNRLFSSEQIAQLLTDGYADLRDRLIVRFAAWFRAEYEFTLTDGEGNNSLDLSLVPDFQMAQGLDYLNGNAPPFTVPMLDSFAERNQYNNLWPLGVGWSYNGFLGRRYWIDGDSLTVFPSQNASGNYRLIYTPMLAPLAIPTTPPPHVVSLDTGDVTAAVGRWQFPAASFNDSDIGATFTVAGAANPGNNGAKVVTAIGNSQTVYTSPTGLTNETFGVGDTASIQPTNTSTRTFDAQPADSFQGGQRQWSISGAAFTASDVGAVLNVLLDAPNKHLNGQMLISTVLSATSVIVETTVATSQTSPVVGTFTVDRRQFGTIPALPQNLTPWAKYPVLFASLAIRASRQQQTQDLEQQFNEMKARVTAATKQRSEGIRQAPLTRGWGGSGGRW